MSEPSESRPPRQLRDRIASPGVQASLLGLLLLALYSANGDFLVVNDALPNQYLPVNFLARGTLSFSPDETPALFAWSFKKEDRSRNVNVPRWSKPIDGVPADRWRADGNLQFQGPKYFVTPSTRSGEFVGIYGPAPGLAALPVFVLGRLVLGDLRDRVGVIAWLGKASACLLVAGSAVFLFLLAARTLSLRHCWVIGIAYGTATCVWSQSSQALWQQSPVLFFTCLGAWAYLRRPFGPGLAALSGFAFMASAACRPTWGLLALTAGLWIPRSEQRLRGAFALGCLPPLALILGFAFTHLESLGEYGQMGIAEGVALVKTGKMEVWQTPILEGAAGVLLSPARGVFVYSPFLAFALWGAWAIWRSPEFASLRPFSVALAGLLLTSFRWFDWWGGYSFGYRLVVDTVPLFMLLLLPVTGSLLSRPGPRAAAALLLAWSVGVQVLGAFAYDGSGWNAREQGVEVRVPNEPGVTVVADAAAAEALAASTRGRVVGPHRLDVDRPENRHRLWSLADTPIEYYLRTFRASREAKRSRIRAMLEGS